MRLVNGGVALVAAMVTVWAAGSAVAQIYEGNKPAKACEGGIDDGERCVSDMDCPGTGPVIPPSAEIPPGSCTGLFLTEFVPTLDNPDVYQVRHRFTDSGNNTTMFAYFDLDGLNFGTGRAQRTVSGTRANFEWITGPPNTLKQRGAKNKVKQKTYVAIRIVFSAVVDVPVAPGDPSDKRVVPLFTYGDCEGNDPCDEDDELLLPLETESCDAKVNVKESVEANEDPDLSTVELDASWKLNCVDIGLPTERDICPNLKVELEDDDDFTIVEDCTEDDLVSAQDLLEAFEGRPDTVRARGKGEVSYCDGFVGNFAAGSAAEEDCCDDGLGEDLPAGCP